MPTICEILRIAAAKGWEALQRYDKREMSAEADDLCGRFASVHPDNQNGEAWDYANDIHGELQEAVETYPDDAPEQTSACDDCGAGDREAHLPTCPTRHAHDPAFG